MEKLRVRNHAPKALRCTSAKGVANASGQTIAAGETAEWPLRPTGDPTDFANFALASNERQWVLAWWTSDGANALAKSSDGSPTHLGCRVKTTVEAVELEIAASDDAVVFDIAPNHGARLVIPKAGWSIREVLTRFQDFIGDPQLLSSGQFIWTARFRAELMARWNQLVDGDREAEQALGHLAEELATVTGQPKMSVADALLFAINGYDDRAFDIVVRKAHERLRATPDVNHALLHMLSPDGNAHDIYRRATDRFRHGGRLRPANGVEQDPLYADLFQDPKRLTFATLRSLTRKCAVECYGWAEAINAHLDSQTLGAGLRGAKLAGHVQASPMSFLYQVRRFDPNVMPAGAGDVLVYDRNLGGSTGDASRDGPIFELMENLDRGMLVTAYCESGIALDQAGNANNPLEHWLLLLGYERTGYGCKFVFWDPDAATSRRVDELEGQGRTTGFGVLHFVAAAAVPSHATPPSCGLPDFYSKTGRFSTESKNGGVLVDDDGMHLNSVDRQGNEDRGERTALQHRYQVGMLRAFATGGA